MPSKGKILLVDDDVDFVMMNKAVLERAGYEVSAAFCGTDGIEAAHTLLPDLIVLDVMMDDVTEGFDVSREVRRDPSIRHVPIIMLTSVNRQFRPLTFGPDPDWLPVDRFLDKPLSAQKLLAEVDALLQK